MTMTTPEALPPPDMRDAEEWVRNRYGVVRAHPEWRGLCEAFNAGRSAALAAPQWQPIETAPRDGSAILVAVGRFIYCVEWNEEFEWWAVDDNKLGPFRLRGQAPTHWHELPQHPKD